MGLGYILIFIISLEKNVWDCGIFAYDPFSRSNYFCSLKFGWIRYRVSDVGLPWNTQMALGWQLQKTTNRKTKCLKSWCNSPASPDLLSSYSKRLLDTWTQNVCISLSLPVLKFSCLFCLTLVLDTEPRLPWWWWGKSRQLQPKANSSNTRTAHISDVTKKKNQLKTGRMT